MSLEQAIWECEKWNNKEGDLNKTDGIDCPICKNKGFIMYKFEDKSMGDWDVRTKWCTCKTQRESSLRALRSGLGDYLNKTSKDYIAIDDWQKDNKNKMISYCKEDIESDKWFIACGQSGSGKTLLVSIIANYLLKNFNKEVRYVTWTDFISQLKRDMLGDNSNTVSKYLDEIKNAEVLFLDELLKVYNQTDLKYAIEIINYRYNNNLKTLITSEHSLKELLKIDEATFGRVIEKSKEYIVETPKDTAKNFRLKNLNKGGKEDEKA